MSVYFVTDGSGWVKIGTAQDTYKRLKDLQIGNPRPLTLLREIDGSVDLEHRFHSYFRNYQAKVSYNITSEWFDANAVLPIISRNNDEFAEWIEKNMEVDGCILLKKNVESIPGLYQVIAELEKQLERYKRLNDEKIELLKQLRSKGIVTQKKGKWVIKEGAN